MDIKKAATAMTKYVDQSNLPAKHPSIGKDHLHEMISAIQMDIVTGEKAHRWLGWIQGCVCVGQGATLDEMKTVNFTA